MKRIIDAFNAIKARAERMPVLGTALAVNERYGRDGGGQFSASIAFFGFLSLFPLLLVSMSVIGFLLNDPVQKQQWLTRLSDAVPGLSAAFGESIEAVVRSRAAIGIVGVLSLIWVGMRVIESASFATNKVFGVDAASNLVKVKGRALVTMTVLGALTFFTLGLSSVVGTADPATAFGQVLRVAGFLVSMALDAVMFIVAYRLLTSGKGPVWRKLVPGGILGGLGWTALKVFGSSYVDNNISNASAVYGTFASIVGALLLLYLAARIYLYGAELNALLIERAGQTKQEALDEAEDDADDADGETAAEAEADATAAAEFERDPRTLVTN